MAKVSIGAFRARLVLETPVETTDSAGGVTRNWTQAASLWGDVATLSALQRQEAQQLGQTLTHRVTVRWRSPLDTSMRFKKGARVFAIRGVYDPEDMTRRLVCLCEEMRA